MDRDTELELGLLDKFRRDMGREPTVDDIRALIADDAKFVACKLTEGKLRDMKDARRKASKARQAAKDAELRAIGKPKRSRV